MNFFSSSWNSTLLALVVVAYKKTKRNFTIIGVAVALIATIAVLYIVGGLSKPVTKTHDWTGQSIELVVVVHPTSDAVNEECQRIHKDTKDRHACAGWSKTEKFCMINVPDLKRQSDPQAERNLGHEVWHCLYGNYHPE